MGCFVGKGEGCRVGTWDGRREGLIVGRRLGLLVGFLVCMIVGAKVGPEGASVGVGVGAHTASLLTLRIT